MSEGVLVFSWTPQAVIATSDSATTNGALTHHHGQWRFTGCCWSLNASPYRPVRWKATTMAWSRPELQQWFTEPVAYLTLTS